MRRIGIEIDEFERMCVEEHGGNNYFEGIDIKDINQHLPESWSDEKKRRFGFWFVMKGLTEGWLLDELGF